MIKPQCKIVFEKKDVTNFTNIIKSRNQIIVPLFVNYLKRLQFDDNVKTLFKLNQYYIIEKNI